LQIVGCNLARRHEAVVFLVDNFDFTVDFDKFKHDNNFAAVIALELDCYRPRCEIWKCLATQCQILKYLNGAKLVVPSFCLNGNDELLACIAYGNVYFIGFDLTDASHESAQVVLKRIRSDSQEDVD